jgi:hypothetical protein
MKKVLVLIMLLIVTFSSFGLALERHTPYENANENDKGLYIYLKAILLYSGIVLDNVIDENNESINYALNLEGRLNVTREEVEFYKSRGIKSKVEDYLPPFLTLGEGIKNIAKGQKLFLENIERVKEEKDYYAYLNATKGLDYMKKGIVESNESLDEMDKLEFLDENGKILKLNTDNLREKLEKIEKLYSAYEKILSVYKVLPPEEYEKLKEKENFIPLPKPLTLYASNLNPFIYENVTFYGYAYGFESVELHIENKSYDVRVKNGYFSFRYSFNKTGIYSVFATGMRDNKLEKSNILTINVTKIPTSIILSSSGSAYVYQNLTINGILLDYYGNPLGDQIVKAEFDGEEILLKTLENRSFSFKIKGEKEGRYLVNVTYLGTEVYEKSFASISVFFLRYPVDIKIEADKEKVGVGKEVRIFGEVKGAERPILISIYVDGKLYQQWLTKTIFGFKIAFNETGTHEIYAYFPGDEYYAPAKSNVVRINVVKITINRSLIIVVLAALLSILIYSFVSKRKTKGITEEEFVKLIKALETEEKAKKVRKLGEIYRDIYYRIIKRYNLKPSLTPRELLRKLSNESFSYELERLTMLHEKYFYGMKRLSRREIIDYIRSAGRFIVGFLVGDSL